VTQKEKTLLILKAIILDEVENEDIKNHLVPKLDSCFDLANPEVLLSLKQTVLFNKLKEDAKKSGKII